MEQTKLLNGSIITMSKKIAELIIKEHKRLGNRRFRPTTIGVNTEKKTKKEDSQLRMF